MFSRWLNWNHRARLTILLTATVSAAMVCVFALVVYLVREQSLNRRFSELEASVTRVAHEWSGPASLREEKDDFPGIDLTVYSSSGRLLASTLSRPPDPIVGRKKLGDALLFGKSDPAKTVIGQSSWLETEAGLKQLALVLGALWLPLTMLTAVVSWYGGGLVLRPVTELVASAQRLSESGESQVLTTTDRAEFASLAASLNQLIGRVRHAASLQEQFASDAAHELRNPLALLQTRIETNLLRPRSPEQHVASQEAMLIQIERLTSIVETLLATARQVGPEATVIDLGECVQRVASEWAEASNWPTSRLSVVTLPGRARIGAGEVEIIVRNLLDNGARHTGEGQPLEVRVNVLSEEVELTVHDFGPGLSKEASTRVFERFYRSDEARNQAHGGAGIGLAVVKRIVESREGRVAFLDVSAGTTVSVRLPRVS